MTPTFLNAILYALLGIVIFVDHVLHYRQDDAL